MGILGDIGNWLGFGATLGSDNDIYGTIGDDYLLGTASGELIVGLGGNDWIKGVGGNDWIDGGQGNDLIEGGSGNDHIDGGLGNDTASYFNSTHGVIANLAFGTASTLGAGPEDSDVLVSIENLTGSFFDDYFQGDELHNRLDGVAGDDVLNGWGGDDFLLGGFGQDLIVGGEGNDRVSGGFDNDKMYGGNGIDTLDYSYAYEAMTISLADGTSHIRFPSGTIDNDSFTGFENVLGSQFNDIIEGSNAANVINGGLGTDTISYLTSSNSVGIALWANAGTLGDALGDTYVSIENIEGSDHFAGDLLAGNDFQNVIDGNGGNDVISGFGGDDTLQGGDGNDVIDGGQGNDIINGGEGADKLDGGEGYDVVDFNPSYGGIGPVGPGVIVDMAAGTVSGLGRDGTTIVNFERLIGTSFEDVMLGDKANNTMNGGVSRDTLVGRGGNDLLKGEDGADTISGSGGVDFLIGGAGRDTLTGGSGNDQFTFFNVTDSAGTARDLVTDFTQSEDLLSLYAIDANQQLAGDQQFEFIGAESFGNVAGQLRSVFIGNNTQVEADVDGDGLADLTILLKGNLLLTSADFSL